jgi:hypothetical protein
MEKDNLKSYLELSIIWKDDEMFQLKVTATNCRYSGTTNVYDTSETLGSFANSLYRYPNENDILFYEAGQGDGYACFSMRFYRIDQAGHIGVEVHMEDYTIGEKRQEEKSKVKLEIIVEPLAIDNFQKELVALARRKEGSATLLGRDN